MLATIALQIALFATLTNAGADDLRPNELIVGGGSSEADGVWVSGPSYTLRRGSPGVAIGMVREPGAESKLAYVLILKGDEGRKVLADYEGKSEVIASTGRSQGFLAIGNQKAAFEYRLDVDPTGKKKAVEKLSINGKELDLAKGRVVLIDLSAADVTWKQTAADLPANPKCPDGTAEVEAQARELLGRLRRGSEDVRAFLK